MKYLRLYEQFIIEATRPSKYDPNAKPGESGSLDWDLPMNPKKSEDDNLDYKQLSNPSKQILLDGTSSSGKSAALKNTNDCVIAVDSFYNLMHEDVGEENFGNKKKISEIYPGNPFGTNPNDGKVAAWYMAQEVKYGQILQNGLKNAKGHTFGRNEDQKTIIYDDVESFIIDESEKAGLGTVKWILVHAPMDHLKKNVLTRNKEDGEGRSLFGVLNSYLSKFEARPMSGGVDPNKSWTKKSIIELLKDTESNPEYLTEQAPSGWIGSFIAKLGIDILEKKDDVEYWIYAKVKPDVIINTRNSKGEQMSIEEVSAEIKKHF